MKRWGNVAVIEGETRESKRSGYYLKASKAFHDRYLEQQQMEKIRVTLPGGRIGYILRRRES